jgi:hypothetical protein
MIADPRAIRKDKALDRMRRELQEINRIKRSPEGKRAFMSRWLEENFGKKTGAIKDE